MGCVDYAIRAPGKIDLADVLTKPDSSLTGLLQLIPYTGRLHVDFSCQTKTNVLRRTMKKRRHMGITLPSIFMSCLNLYNWVSKLLALLHRQ